MSKEKESAYLSFAAEERGKIALISGFVSSLFVVWSKTRHNTGILFVFGIFEQPR
jgi:hypothetical protein